MTVMMVMMFLMFVMAMIFVMVENVSDPWWPSEHGSYFFMRIFQIDIFPSIGCTRAWLGGQNFGEINGRMVLIYIFQGRDIFSHFFSKKSADISRDLPVI